MTNPIKRFFLFCSGATRSILEMNGCEVDHVKYAGIGVTIFFTAVLAALSGGYAMFTAFRNGWLSFAFGLLWGLIIFNLDRSIVSSIRKKKIPANAPFAERLAAKGGEVLKALPRLILAVFISIVITKPLELKLFAVEIEGQMSQALVAERTNVDQTINAEYADIPVAEADIQKLRQRSLDLEDERNKRVRAAAGEAGGFSGSGDPGYGPKYAERQAEVTKAEAELKAFQKTFQPLIETREKQLNDRKAERDLKIAKAKGLIDNSRGLLKQLEALSAMTERWSVFWASMFIVLLFISLETAPILVKLFSNRGPYDDYLDAIEHRVYATQRQTISDTNDEINTLVALSRQRNADRISIELQMSQNTMASWTTLAPQEYLDAQVEIARIGVALWRANELNRLRQVAPPVANAGQSSQPTTQSQASATANPAPPNVWPTTSPAGVTNPAGASATGAPVSPSVSPAGSPPVSPPASSPAAASNNGGGVQPNVGAVTPSAPAQSASAVGVQAATAGAQSSSATSQLGSTAPQTASPPAPASVPPLVQASQTLNSSTSGPGTLEQGP